MASKNDNTSSQAASKPSTPKKISRTPENLENSAKEGESSSASVVQAGHKEKERKSWSKNNENRAEVKTRAMLEQQVSMLEKQLKQRDENLKEKESQCEKTKLQLAKTQDELKNVAGN